MNCCFDASSLDFGRRHLVFLEPEVTIFVRDFEEDLKLEIKTIKSFGTSLLRE